MKPTEKHEVLARFFTGLGHKRRLMICKILLDHGPAGLSFELLQSRSRLAASTLSHHLEKMYRGGILRRRAKGRETWLSMDISHLLATTTVFSETCRNQVAVHPVRGVVAGG